MLSQLVLLCILLLAAVANLSQADTNEVDTFKCDLLPEIDDIEGYEERCVKKNVPVIVMKKNLRSGRIVNQDGQNRNRPGPYRRQTTTPRTYYRRRTTTPITYYWRRTTTPRTYYYIDRTDEYDDSDYPDYEEEEYYVDDEDDGCEFFELVFDIFF